MNVIKTAIFVVGSLLLSACVITEPSLEAYVVNVTPLPSSLLEQRAQLTVRLQNLSDVAIEAQGIDVRLMVNDRQLARGVAAQAITIAGLSETTASVNVSSRAIDTIRQIVSMQQREQYSYRLKGRLHVAGLDKRFDHGGQISRRELMGLLQGTR